VTAFTAATALPELIRRGVFPTRFSIEGVHDGTSREGNLLLRRAGDGWAITLRDRSDRRDIAFYESEGIAADAFVEMVSRDNGVL